LRRFFAIFGRFWFSYKSISGFFHSLDSKPPSVCTEMADCLSANPPYSSSLVAASRTAPFSECGKKFLMVANASPAVDCIAARA
jgi:hypothetical protein